MKFGGRLQAAIEVLADIETRHRPVSEALKDWGLSHRFAGSGDRAAIGNVVYDALRWRASGAWVMGEETPRAVALATIIRRWGMNTAQLAVAFAQDSHAAAPPTADEIARLESADLASAPDHVRADTPEWVAPRFARVFGVDWVAEGEALALRPPLDMRANRLLANRDKVQKALAKFGARETAYSPDGVRVPPTAGEARHPNVQVEPAFQKGWFEIQDEGSQIAALAVGAKQGEQILDLCAGAGGKTLALAAAMANKGRLIATDEDRMRLAPIFERVKRAGAHNVEIREARSSLDDLAGKMDAVLIDAPCTGTGVWRRRPDAKWRLTERALGNRLGEQTAILDAARRYVKANGRIVYVTCSLLPEEDDDQVATFLGAQSGYRPVPPAEVVSRPGLAAELAEGALATPHGIILSPRRTGTDGFFVAILERIQ